MSPLGKEPSSPYVNPDKDGLNLIIKSYDVKQSIDALRRNPHRQDSEEAKHERQTSRRQRLAENSHLLNSGRRSVSSNNNASSAVYGAHNPSPREKEPFSYPQKIKIPNAVKKQMSLGKPTPVKPTALKVQKQNQSE